MGKYNCQQPNSSPSGESLHFESLLNSNYHDATENSHDLPYIPLLDDPIDDVDLEDAIVIQYE